MTTGCLLFKSLVQIFHRFLNQNHLRFFVVKIFFQQVIVFLKKLEKEKDIDRDNSRMTKKDTKKGYSFVLHLIQQRRVLLL